MTRFRVVLIGIVLAVVVLYGLVLVANYSTSPARIGVVDGKLTPCPDLPNCVSTQSTQSEKWLPPLEMTGSTEQAAEKLKAVLESMPGTRLVRQSENYLHFEVRSPLMRFVDDVEFLINPHQKQIDFRSASRIGYSDLGVNRTRMEKISRKFQHSP